MNFFNKLSNTYKGLAFIALGFLLFLYSIGIFRQTLSLVIILGAVALMLYGFILGDFWTKINGILKHKK